MSAIYYHFGDMEQLLLAAQAEARAEAMGWCTVQLEAIRGDVRGAAALGRLLATLVDDWCETRRTLAFARRECQLMALREARHIALSAKWDVLWQGFWQEVCDRLDLPDVAVMTAWIFDGACGLHLLRWRRPVDRAALAELCDGWADWLEGRLAGPADWFDLAHRDAAALILPSPLDDEVANAIAAAAAATVAKRGVAALTHRAVAAEAGMTLGVVSYKFRTSAELLKAAFEAIYRRMVPPLPGVPTPPVAKGGEAGARHAAGVPTPADLLGAEELLVAASRDPEFQAFAAQLHYLRGGSAGRVLQELLGLDGPLAPADRAISSMLLAGRVRAYACGGLAANPNPLEKDFAPLLARFGRR
jgi:AcrR family transcriptional regulator